MNHPKDKQERKKIALAKAMKRRPTHAKKHLKTEIEDKESQDELRSVTGNNDVSGTALRADQTEALLDGIRS